eukprot:239873_1
MNKVQHQGSVRCVCWHSSNPRIILSGGDDRSIRLWRLYPQNELYQSNGNKPNKTHSSDHKSPTNEAHSDLKSDNESDEDVELRYESDDDDPTQFITDFDPSIQPISHLLCMPASGEVKGLCMSPFDGETVVATSSRKFNQRSSLDIIHIPHWTWNYSSKQRLPYRTQLQLAEKERLEEEEANTNVATSSPQLDDDNPFIENRDQNVSSDFVNRPSVIPLPYGAREGCIAFSPCPHIVFVGLLSCRKKHQRRYCCLMACNILNGASRACKMMNAILHRKECVYCVQLTETNDETKRHRLAFGTNLGRLVVVTLKEDLSWSKTRDAFIDEYTIGVKEEDEQQHNVEKQQGEDERHKNASKKKSKHHRKLSSKSLKYSVLTSRERCFREMADPMTVMITFESMKRYLWNESSQIEERDISEFFKFLGPNKKNQISFTQFVRRVDEDGNFVRAFEQFCLSGSSRTDRRAWMDDDEKEEETQAQAHEDAEWEFAMRNDRSGDHLTDEDAITAIVWSGYDAWIISGHSSGDIRFWSKQMKKGKSSDKYLCESAFCYVCRGVMRRHSESISGLSLRGTYLVSASLDGNILIWHLDFLLPSVSLPIQNHIIQLLASINSAHLGDQVSDVTLSSSTDALYLLSAGADQSIRCRHVMEVLRQQLTLRILAESQPKPNMNDINASDSDDGSDFGATTYN